MSTLFGVLFIAIICKIVKMYSVLMLQNEYICKINKFKNVNHYSFIASQTQTLSRGIAFALI